MKPKSYTFFIAFSPHGNMRRVRVPLAVLHVMLALSVVGGVTVLAGVGSYSRMLWKVTDYNSLRREKDTLKKQYTHLQAVVKDTNQRLSSLQGLATQVALTYGIMRFRQTPFGLAEGPVDSEAAYRQSVEQFDFLVRNASAVALASDGLRLMPGRGFEEFKYTPSLWPVLGHVTGSFGERMDPFSGEGAFHAGVDISSYYGDEVRVAADGMVVAVETRPGYGRLVIVDHGFGLTTWYGHLSGFKTRVGAQVTRGEVVGYVGTSGRASGPHVHYEVRSYGAPVNPWRYLRGGSATD